MIELGRAAPGIPVSDIARAVRFYTDVFGMHKTFENGDPVQFAIMKGGAAELHLTLVSQHGGREHNVAHLLVESGVDELYRRCQAAGGATIVKPLRDAPWGLRTFVVADPDGNRIDIGQPL